jgi:hypothetical protein
MGITTLAPALSVRREVGVALEGKTQTSTNAAKLRDAHVAQLRAIESDITEAKGTIRLTRVELGEEPGRAEVGREEPDDSVAGVLGGGGSLAIRAAGTADRSAYCQLCAAQQALAWAFNPGTIAPPCETILRDPVGPPIYTQEGSGDCPAGRHHSPS